MLQFNSDNCIQLHRLLVRLSVPPVWIPEKSIVRVKGEVQHLLGPKKFDICSGFNSDGHLKRRRSPVAVSVQYPFKGGNRYNEIRTS